MGEKLIAKVLTTMNKLEGVLAERLMESVNRYFPRCEKPEEFGEDCPMRRGQGMALFADSMTLMRELIKAFGGCTRCYGKGYGTETVYVSSWKSREQKDELVPCECERGKQFAKIIEHGQVHTRKSAQV